MDATRAPITAWAPSSPSHRVIHENPSGRMRRQGPRRAAYAAFLCFGLASWVMTNTTYVELSYFMLHLPERLTIVPYAIFALQSANVYPIVYMWLNANHRYVSLVRAVWICLFIALVVAVCMSVLWDRTAYFLGGSHSVAMLVLTHFGGLVSAVTTVIFYPYVATFPAIYTSALSTGEGLSGAIVGLLGLWQQPYADELAFSVSTFYVAGVVIVVASIASFAFLEFHPSVSAERERIVVGIAGESRRKVHTYDSTFIDSEEGRAVPSTCSLRQRVFGWFWRELACQAVLAALFYGVLPSITSFLFTRYSPQEPARAAEHQMLASTVVFFVDPAARFLTSFFRVYTVYLATLFLVVAGVVLIVCTLLRSPPLSGYRDAGFLFPLVLYIASSGVYSYTQTMLMLTVKQQADCTRDALFAGAAYQWSGFAIQMGAFAGTLVIFPLTLACAPGATPSRSTKQPTTRPPAMRQLTLFPPRRDVHTEPQEDDIAAERDRLHSMRRASGSRSPRATSESDYVSLADLTGTPPRSVAARAARLVGLSSRGDGDAASDADHALVPLTAAGTRRLGCVQDALLAAIAALCVSLACWACSQLYSGHLCATTTPLSQSPPESINATTTGQERCTLLRNASRRFASRGAPDVSFRGHVFEGGWPLPNTLLHVLTPVAVLLCVVAMRIHASTVHHSLAWLWLGLVQLSIIVIDTLALRRWRGPICRQLQAAIAASLTPQTTKRWSGKCETLAYEAFVATEVLLVTALALLVLLEPVLFRLWCGVGRCDNIEDSDVKDTVETLQREDAPSPREAYRRL